VRATANVDVWIRRFDYW